MVTVKPAYTTTMRLVPGFDNSGTTVSAPSDTTVVLDGTVNGMLFSTGYEELFIETTLNSTTYATSMGICTFGVPCKLGDFILLLEPDSNHKDNSSGEGTGNEPTVCLQNVSTFQLADGGSLTLNGECMDVTDAEQLAGLTVIFNFGASDDELVTASGFQFWSSTAKLSYTLERYSYTDVLFTQKCSVDGEDATCVVVNPFEVTLGSDSDSLSATVISMTVDFISNLIR